MAYALAFDSVFLMAFVTQYVLGSDSEFLTVFVKPFVISYE